MPTIGNANGIIEQQLDCCTRELENELVADGLCFSGDIAYGADDLIRDAMEERKNKRAKLAVVLETSGGYIEVAQRMLVPKILTTSIPEILATPA